MKLLVIIVLFLQIETDIVCQEFTFSGVKSEERCGLEDDLQSWSTTGTFRINTTAVGFVPEVSIKAANRRQCSIDISNCAPTVATGHSGSSRCCCVCTDNTSNVYTLNVTQPADRTFSGQNVVAVYHPGILSGEKSVEYVIGRLPIMYGRAKATYEVYWGASNDVNKSHLEAKQLQANQALHVGRGDDVNVTYCVANLLQPFTLSVHQEEKTNQTCVSTVVQSNVGSVSLSHAEFSGCNRTQSYILDIVDTEPTTAIPAVATYASTDQTPPRGPSGLPPSGGHQAAATTPQGNAGDTVNKRESDSSMQTSPHAGLLIGGAVVALLSLLL